MKRSHRILSLLLVLTLTLSTTACKKLFKRHTKILTLKIDNGPEIKFTDISSFEVDGSIFITGDNDDGQLNILLDSELNEGTYTGNQDIMDYGININYGSDSQSVFNTMVNAINTVFVVSEHKKGRYIKGYFTLDYANLDTQTAHSVRGTFDVTY